MSTMNINFPVSGYARGAASVRPSTAAPRPWMSEAGVCPAADALRSRIGDTALAVLIGGRVDDRQYTPEYHRQSKHETGYPDLRPPV